MAICTNVGYSGNNVPLPDLITTTSSLTCFVSGYTQTGNTITVSIWATGGTTALATISGGGRGGALTAMSTASFQLQSGTTYYAVVSSTQPLGLTQVLTGYDALSYGTTTYAGGYTFCVEDTPSGGDCDFNDALINLNWTLFGG